MVIVIWLVILCPLYLKRHDREELEKLLSEPLVDQLAQRWGAVSREQVTPKEQAFIRRRRASMTLLTWLIGTALLAATGHVSIYWIVVPVSLTILFVVAAARSARQAKPVKRSTSRNQATVTPVVSPSQVLLDSTIPETKQTSTRTWRPIESPLPSYVTADRATPYPRGIDAQKPWTAAEMLEQAAQMRALRAERIKQAQQRLDEARALAMEKARRAAIAAATEQEAVRRLRAVNE